MSLGLTVDLTDNDRRLLGEGMTYSPGNRSWRGSALCIPENAPTEIARQMHSARGGKYVYRPFWNDPPRSWWPQRAGELHAEYQCNMCSLAGLAAPGPWVALRDGHLWARCGGNGILVHVCGDLPTWGVAPIADDQTRVT